jgi:hypothetical protein
MKKTHGHARPSRHTHARKTQNGEPDWSDIIFLLCVCLHQIVIIVSCPILVLTTNVLERLRRTDAKNSVKNYQGYTTSRENAIQKYPNFPEMFS